MHTRPFSLILSNRNKQVLDAVDLDTAPYERTTTGAWIDIPKETLMLLLTHDLNPAEAIHAAQHAFLNRFPMSADLRTECKQVCLQLHRVNGSIANLWDRQTRNMRKHRLRGRGLED
jgi:ATP-dependent helicase YprA (DUF1998 family)